MEELKACSLEAAQKWVEKELNDYFTDDEYLVGPEIEEVEALMCIRNELNRRAAPENKPLTLEQLRKMGGEPVWCEVLKEYGIVCLNIEWPAKECVWLPHGAHPISELIKGGIYASKPEGSENNGQTNS